MPALANFDKKVGTQVGDVAQDFTTTYFLLLVQHHSSLFDSSSGHDVIMSA